MSDIFTAGALILEAIGVIVFAGIGYAGFRVAMARRDWLISQLQSEVAAIRSQRDEDKEECNSRLSALEEEHGRTLEAIEQRQRESMDKLWVAINDVEQRRVEHSQRFEAKIDGLARDLNQLIGAVGAQVQKS